VGVGCGGTGEVRNTNWKEKRRKLLSERLESQEEVVVGWFSLWQHKKKKSDGVHKCILFFFLSLFIEKKKGLSLFSFWTSHDFFFLVFFFLFCRLIDVAIQSPPKQVTSY